MVERLFVYGTLHPKRAPKEIADIVRAFRKVGNGKVRGRLYDLGEFPGLVLDAKANQVKGEVFQIPQTLNALSRLDTYEEFLPDSPEESLFLRKQTSVTFEDGSRKTCWVYVYNHPVSQSLDQPKLASVA